MKRCSGPLRVKVARMPRRLLVVLIAAALLLHHSAHRIEWDMKHSIR
jgi:hypothetical protein